MSSPTRLTRSLAYVLCATVAPSGCAIEPTLPAKAQIWLRNDEALPAGRFALPPIVVADERVIDTSALEPGEEERVAFDERRATAINFAAFVKDDDAKIVAAGLPPPVCYLLLPACLAVFTAVLGTVKVVKAANASNRIAEMVPASDGARFAALVREEATASALSERLALRVTPANAGDGESPRLVVGMVRVRVNYHGSHTVFSFTARAQGISPDGVRWPASEHIYECGSRPLSEWTAQGDAALRHALAEALDGLAISIATTYDAPTHPAPTHLFGSQL